MQENKKSELEQLIKEVPASSIPLEPKKEAPPTPLVNIDKAAEEFWASKSNQIFTDYRFGKGIAYFGENDSSVITFYKRLSYALHTIIANELLKRGESSESLTYHFRILDSSLTLLSKEIAKKELKDFDITSTIAALHGFVTNYIHEKRTKNE